MPYAVNDLYLLDPVGDDPLVMAKIIQENNQKLATSVNNKITAPTTASSGNILSYNGTDWEASSLSVDEADFGQNAWNTYTPDMKVGGTAITLGNGTAEGRYRKLDRHITVMARVIWGTTTTLGASTGSLSLSLPSGGSFVWDQYHPVGTGVAWDNSAGTWHPLIARAGTSADADDVYFYDLGAGGAADHNNPIVTWATSDRLECTITYETAS